MTRSRDSGDVWPSPEDESERAASRHSADEALARLVAGNERFVQGAARRRPEREALAELAKAQHPHATILGCSDSRVSPELVFDAALGELFVVRVAGNIVSPEILATVQFAGLYLRIPLIVVLGHEGCGAVTAALAARRRGVAEPVPLGPLLQNILHGLAAVDEALTPEAQLEAAVESNVRWTLRQLLEAPAATTGLPTGEVALVGAVYDLKSGRVRFLPSI